MNFLKQYIIDRLNQESKLLHTSKKETLTLVGKMTFLHLLPYLTFGKAVCFIYVHKSQKILSVEDRSNMTHRGFLKSIALPCCKD